MQGPVEKWAKLLVDEVNAPVDLVVVPDVVDDLKAAPVLQQNDAG